MIFWAALSALRSRFFVPLAAQKELLSGRAAYDLPQVNPKGSILIAVGETCGNKLKECNVNKGLNIKNRKIINGRYFLSKLISVRNTNKKLMNKSVVFASGFVLSGKKRGTSGCMRFDLKKEYVGFNTDSCIGIYGKTEHTKDES